MQSNVIISVADRSMVLIDAQHLLAVLVMPVLPTVVRENTLPNQTTEVEYLTSSEINDTRSGALPKAAWPLSPSS
jgi:hypothetical protein